MADYVNARYNILAFLTHADFAVTDKRTHTAAKPRLLMV